jgi:hypothetical protein
MKSELLPSGLPHAVCSQITADINDIGLQIFFYDKHCNSALVQCNSDRYRSGYAIENR